MAARTGSRRRRRGRRWNGMRRPQRTGPTRSSPGDRGTELRVTLEYDPPFGKFGSKVAMLWREEPGQQIADDLRHFKQVMETGEIVFSDATKQRGMHPAQPDERPVEL